MLPTFVIGLREGLEAALIVGIIAAFLRKQGELRLVRWVWVGVAAAAAICLGIGIALQVLSSHLPQRQQEMLETVIGALAVVLVTSMVVWMRRHSRELKGQLETMTSQALTSGRRVGLALVAMAFLAVFREGIETAVFLLAAFQASTNTGGAVLGLVLGLACAIALGYGIYRGGVRLNLSKFFRVTGFLLVLVAGGLVVNVLHTAHEAGWLNLGQERAFDLSWLVTPGSVHASLLTGMLGLQPFPTVIEVAGWLVYVVPVGLYVAWPPGKGLAPRTTAKLTAAAAGIAAVVTIGLVVAAPGVPHGSAVSGDQLSVRVTDPPAGEKPTVTAEVSVPEGQPETVTLKHTGTDVRDDLQADVYTATSHPDVDGQPAKLSRAKVIALNGGRLPLGLSAADGDSLPASYAATTTTTVWLEPDSGQIVDASVDTVVTATITSPRVGAIALGKPVLNHTDSLTDAESAQAAQAAAQARDDAARRDRLRAYAWLTGLVTLGCCTAALVLWRQAEPEQAPRDSQRIPADKVSLT
ncbi:MAG: FTR1 family protein [Nocardioidaceae bacterium]